VSMQYVFFDRCAQVFKLFAEEATRWLTHLASVKLSLGLDWNNQSPRMCVAFLPPSVGVVKSKGLISE
jgi:hypothetical protein